MEITFTAKIPQEGVQELMALLARLWDSPNPAAEVSIHTVDTSKTAPTPVEQPAAPVATTAVPVQTAPISSPPAPAAPVQAAPASADDQYTVEAIGRAAAAFVDADPANMDKLLSCLQGMGVQAVTQLPDAAARAEFARRMRELVAKL